MAEKLSDRSYLSISELPKWRRECIIPLPEQIAAYLKKVIDTHSERETSYLELPSFNQLSGFFHCSHLDIFEALEILSEKEIEHRFLDMDSLLAIWRA